MGHHLKISVTKKPQTDGAFSCRNVTLRERMLRLLLGDRRRVTIILPGDSVEEVSICDAEEGGANEPD